MRNSENKMRDSYNKAAADMRNGLSELQSLPESCFEFEVSEGPDGLRIKTNIPDMGEKGERKITLAVEPNGRVTVDGGDYFVNDPWAGLGGYSTQQLASTRRNAVKKALKHVKKKAKDQGLIPK